MAKASNKNSTKQARETLAHHAKLAAKGELPWMDKIIRDAGYLPAGPEIKQKDLVAAIPGLTRKTLSDWETQNLPCIKKGRSKVYNALDYIEWIHGRFVKGGRQSSAEGSAKHEAEIQRTKAQAQLAELRVEEKRGSLMSRAEAESILVAMILEVRAAFISMPIALAPQLEGLSKERIEKLLNERINWLLERFSRGEVEVPEKAAKVISATITEVMKGKK